MPHSMTAFARKQQAHEQGSMSCELRSVNHRFLEYNIKLPETLRELEMPVRALIQQHLRRGKVECRFNFKLADTALLNFNLNHALLQRVLYAAREVKSELNSPADLNALEFLKWPGMLMEPEMDMEQIRQIVLNLVEATLEDLIVVRQREGKILAEVIQQRLQDIRQQIQPLKSSIQTVLIEQRQRLEQKLSQLSVTIDPDRLEQEVVLLVQKNDIEEEIDRLLVHVDEVERILQQDNVMGRRLDFLTQELNREANTLSSKLGNIDITQRAIETKVLIEQIREQAQNLE